MAQGRHGGRLVACRKRELYHAEFVDHEVRIEHEYERDEIIPPNSVIIYSPNGALIDVLSPEGYQRLFEEIEEDPV